MKLLNILNSLYFAVQEKSLYATCIQKAKAFTKSLRDFSISNVKSLQKVHSQVACAIHVASDSYEVFVEILLCCETMFLFFCTFFKSCAYMFSVKEVVRNF